MRARAETHTHTHELALAGAQKHTHTHTHARMHTHARTHACTHTHAHTNSNDYTCGAGIPQRTTRHSKPRVQRTLQDPGPKLPARQPLTSPTVKDICTWIFSSSSANTFLYQRGKRCSCTLGVLWAVSFFMTLGVVTLVANVRHCPCPRKERGRNCVGQLTNFHCMFFTDFVLKLFFSMVIFFFSSFFYNFTEN